jgi:hypothetical protein
MNPLLNSEDDSHQKPDRHSAARLSWDWKWFKYWTIVYFLNVFMPLLLAIQVTSTDSRIGVGIGIGICWLLGLAIQYLPKSIRSSTISGSIVIGIFQFLPLSPLSLIAGMLAEYSIKTLTGLDIGSSGFNGILAGFAVTIVTGQILLLIALVFSLPINLLRVLWNDRMQPDDVPTSIPQHGHTMGE